jgi:hypothetical protein
MLLLYRGKSFVSWRVKAATLSQYSHESLLKTTQCLRDAIRACNGSLPDDLQRCIINAGCLEAWHIGGVRETQSLYEGHKRGTVIDIYDLPEMEDFKWAIMEQVFRAEKGKDYWFGGILYARLNTWASKEPPMDEHGNIRKWFCSMLGEHARRFVDFPTVDLRCPIHGVWPGKTADSTRTRYVGSVTL